jgi:hypothetical protein
MTTAQKLPHATLTFRVNPGVPGSQSADLAIEVRRINLSLVDRTVASKGLELGPGAYYLTSTLPNGHEITRSIYVSEPGTKAPEGWAGAEVERVDLGESKVVELADHSGKTVPALPDLLTDFEIGPNILNSRLPEAIPFDSRDELPDADKGERLGQLDRQPEAAATVWLRWFRGNPLASEGNGLVPRSDLPEFLEPASELPVEPDPRSPELPQLVQLDQPGLPVRNVMLPVALGSPCAIAIQPAGSNGLTLQVRLAHAGADLYFRYLRAGQLTQAATLCRALADDELLMVPSNDPIATAVVAYALLRFRHKSRFGERTSMLMNDFPNLPDGLALYGEEMARAGEHARALAAFNEIPNRGLPIFSAGLSFAIDRLRQYLSVDADTEFDTLDKPALDRAKTVLALLQPYALFSVFESPLLSYPGDPPDRPGRSDPGGRGETGGQTIR